MAGIKQWLRNNTVNLILLSILISLFVWIWRIVCGNANDKAQWLLLPITGIYVVVSVYMAAGAIIAARASQKSAEVMEQTLGEMRLSRVIQYSPWFSFPDGYCCTLHEDDTVSFQLHNLFAVPIAGLWVMLWELEKSPDGSMTVKYSSMRESTPRDYARDESVIELRLQLSSRTDAEKLNYGKLFEDEFSQRFGAAPARSLLAMLYYVKGEPHAHTLFYDFEILPDQTSSPLPNSRMN